MHILPGDPARLALGEYASEADVQALREKLNLDKPLWQQYVNWIGSVLKGDFGYSLVYNRQIGDLLRERLPKTLAIGVPALVISVIVGILAGTACAVGHGKRIDRIITFLSTVGIGTPVFWIGILGIYVASMKWHILPIQGYVKMAGEGRYAEALRLIKQDNPFPAVCGAICNKRCEDACRATQGDGIPAGTPHRRQVP